MPARDVQPGDQLHKDPAAFNPDDPKPGFAPAEVVERVRIDDKAVILTLPSGDEWFTPEVLLQITRRSRAEDQSAADGQLPAL